MKKQILFSVLMILIVVCILSLVSAQETGGGVGATEGKGSISGFIYPIVEGATVMIKKFGATEFDRKSIIRGDGGYEFTDLEPDTYGLFVRFNATQNFYDYKWGMIDIAANTSLSGFNLTLTPKNSSYLLDRVMVKFQPDVTEEEKRNIIESYNSTLMSHYEYSRYYTVNIPRDKTVEEMIELFQTNSKVKSAYPVGITHTGEVIETGEDIQECIKEKQELYGPVPHYVLGYIAVIFEENVTLEEAITLLESYNLSIDDNSFPSYIGITFAEGTEIEWKCILEENKIVKHGALITAGVTMGPEENITEEMLVFICGNDICEAGENCENCMADCACAGHEECVEGECKVKETPYPKLPWFWVIIITVTMVLVVLILIIRNKSKLLSFLSKISTG